jgi:sensor histidine kinase YesM
MEETINGLKQEVTDKHMRSKYQEDKALDPQIQTHILYAVKSS